MKNGLVQTTRTWGNVRSVGTPQINTSKRTTVKQVKMSTLQHEKKVRKKRKRTQETATLLKIVLQGPCAQKTNET